MKYTTPLRRCCALLLCAALSLPTVAFADQGKARIRTEYQLTDDLTYTNTVSEHPAGRVESFTVELEENRDVFPILLQSSGTVYATSTINAAVQRAQDMGYQVLAAINTDYFAPSTGVPQGIVIEDGVYKSDPVGYPAMLIVDNEVMLCEEPEITLTLTNEETGEVVTPDYFNKYRTPTGGVYLLNEHFSTVSTRTSTPGWYVRMQVVDYDPEDEDYQLGVNSELELEMVELLHSDRPLVIHPGEYILTADDVCGKSGVSNAFRVGDRITLRTECEDDDLSDAQWAGGVGNTLVEDGDVTNPAAWNMITTPTTTRAPRSALGVRRDGTLVLYAVDGRQNNHSVGLTATDLADQMVELDCEWAVNLDGGGSTAASVWVPGKNGIAVQNSPSDGKVRPCATFLLLVTEERRSSREDRLALSQDGLVVLTDSSVVLPEAVVLDRYLNVLDESVSDLTVRCDLGDFEDGVYTAGSRDGLDELYLRSRRAGVTGDAQIHVVDTLSTLTITADGKAVTALTLDPGQSVQLGASGTYWGRTALRGLEGVDIDVDEDLGEVDENGVLTLVDKAGLTGSITFRAGGLKTTLPVTIRSAHTDVPPGHWAYDAVAYCYDKGIVSGISPTLFGVDGQIRRADFMLMLYAALGRPPVHSPCTFTDVTPDDYFYTGLSWAQSQGLISGVGDGTCAATASITREQVFTILRKAMPLLGYDCEDAPLSALEQFADRDQIADYAQRQTATMAAQGLLERYGSKLDPKGALTRVEMADLLYKIRTYNSVDDYSHLTPDPKPVEPTQPAEPAQPEQPQVPADKPTVDALTIAAQLFGSQLAEDPVLASVTGAENGLNIRSGPGTSYDVLASLAPNEVVIVVERLDNWYRILYLQDPQTLAAGFVSASYLTIDD